MLPAGQLAMTPPRVDRLLTPIVNAIERERYPDYWADDLRAVVAWHDRQHDEL